MSYEEDHARILEAFATIDELYAATIKEAEARGEVYVLHFHRLGVALAESFFTLNEALEYAEGDLAPEVIIAPDGRELDPRNNGKPISGRSG